MSSCCIFGPELQIDTLVGPAVRHSALPRERFSPLALFGSDGLSWRCQFIEAKRTCPCASVVISTAICTRGWHTEARRGTKNCSDNKAGRSQPSNPFLGTTCARAHNPTSSDAFRTSSLNACSARCIGLRRVRASRSAARVLRAGSTHLCMGLFSRFFVQALPCTAEGTVCRVRDTRSLVPRTYGTNRSSSNTSCSSGG